MLTRLEFPRKPYNSSKFWSISHHIRTACLWHLITYVSEQLAYRIYFENDINFAGPWDPEQSIIRAQLEEDIGET